MGYRGRFAPSPTGPLHRGSACAALGSWLDARAHGGSWLIRIEDVDRPRTVAGAAESQLQMLAAMGMLSDEPVLRQSERDDAYQRALDQLVDQGLAFACSCSRTDLALYHGRHPRCVRAADPRQHAWRLRAGESPIEFADRRLGAQRWSLADLCGDFVIRRNDGLFAYQLAVVVDDAAQSISHVVRGADLLDSTPRQIALQRALGLPTPRYLHLDLVRDGHGAKLSKSEGADALDPAQPLAALQHAWLDLGGHAEAVRHAATVGDFLQCALRTHAESSLIERR
ncbi:MAG: tRNA glutamyl-Q(34) synthetase GluQRS [Xanthomonadales bacterium]|nr:tRNA glutamyl-Q(34) synthetase GluQRS [Xanthomonadales bacterium]